MATAATAQAITGLVREARATSGSHDPIESRRCRNRVRLGFKNGGRQARLATTVESFLARHHFIEDDAEREDVGARVDVTALELLGRHVAKRSENGAFAGEISLLRRCGRVDLSDFVVTLLLCQSEIEQLRCCGTQHDVAGLHVAVDHSVLMRLVQGIRDLDTVSERVVQAERPPRQPIGERFTFEQFHDDEINAVLTTHVVHGAYVWVIQARDRARLTLEPLAKLGVVRKMRRQNFDRDGTPETSVFGLVDLPHTAGANGLHDAIRPQFRAGSKGHS